MRHASAAVIRGLLVAVLVLAGCGDGAGPGEEVLPAALVGTWESGLACHPSCAVTLTPVANPAVTFDATKATALSTEIQIRRDGRLTLYFGLGPEVGSARVDGSTLIVTDARGVVDTIDYVVSSTHLDLRFRRPFELFDFTGDGLADPAYMRMISVRRP